MLVIFFQGIGVALVLAQALIGIYSVVGVSWMFVYFRDSFITKQDTYRWAEPFTLYREGTQLKTFKFIVTGLSISLSTLLIDQNNCEFAQKNVEYFPTVCFMLNRIE